MGRSTLFWEAIQGWATVPHYWMKKKQQISEDVQAALHCEFKNNKGSNICKNA
jgi:hypothetical protein